MDCYKYSQLKPGTLLKFKQSLYLFSDLGNLQFQKGSIALFLKIEARYQSNVLIVLINNNVYDIRLSEALLRDYIEIICDV